MERIKRKSIFTSESKNALKKAESNILKNRFSDSLRHKKQATEELSNDRLQRLSRINESVLVEHEDDVDRKQEEMYKPLKRICLTLTKSNDATSERHD